MTLGGTRQSRPLASSISTAMSRLMPIKPRSAMVTVRRRPLTYLFGFLMLPAALFVGLAPAAAQGLSPLGASSDSRPIDITADSGIEWQQNKQVYIAHGNAVATRGANEVHADTLTAHYRPSKSKNAEG